MFCTRERADRQQCNVHLVHMPPMRAYVLSLLLSSMLLLLRSRGRRLDIYTFHATHKMHNGTAWTISSTGAKGFTCTVTKIRDAAERTDVLVQRRNTRTHTYALLCICVYRIVRVRVYTRVVRILVTRFWGRLKILRGRFTCHFIYTWPMPLACPRPTVIIIVAIITL